MANTITGWDIGGAHLKVACIDAAGRLLYVEQFATPLWRGDDELDRILSGVRELLGGGASRHVVTMTAELADCFRDRRDGVNRILAYFSRHFPAEDIRVYAGEAGLVGVEQADELFEHIASANWLATAEYLAGFYRDGLLLDIGSTTTDIIPFAAGRPVHTGKTDHRRLQTGELVYTGIVRTPVMAIVGKVPFRGVWQGVAAEHFAVMADVYRITGRLQEQHDLQETADGAGKSVADSIRRLARMLGLDADDTIPREEWTALAQYIAEQQRMMISEAIEQITAGFDKPLPVFIGAGCGRFLLPVLAQDADCRVEDFAAHLETGPSLHDKAGDNATAVSVARLAFMEQS
ncbi:MAG: hydantoinase/oxoprolinase family protein [Gammaproteobacteria bacterium]